MPVVSGPPPVIAQDKPKAAPRATATMRKRRDSVNGIFQLAGFGLMMGRQYADAGAISKHGPGITDEIARLAEDDARLADAVDRLTSVGPYGALIAAVSPLVIQVMVNHGRINAVPAMRDMGVVPKAELEAEIQAAMALQEQVALLHAQEAEELLARARHGERRYAGSAERVHDGQPSPGQASGEPQ
jgi:hypothetical protein